MMAETLCTFLLTASLLMCEKRATARAPHAAIGTGAYAGLGLLAGVTSLTRPLYVVLAPFYFVVLLLAFKGHGGAALSGEEATAHSRLRCSF